MLIGTEKMGTEGVIIFKSWVHSLAEIVGLTLTLKVVKKL